MVDKKSRPREATALLMLRQGRSSSSYCGNCASPFFTECLKWDIEKGDHISFCCQCDAAAAAATKVKDSLPFAAFSLQLAFQIKEL